MKVKIGDKVRFLSETGGGKVAGFQKGNIVLQASPNLIGIIFSAKGGDGWYDFDNEAEEKGNFQTQCILQSRWSGRHSQKDLLLILES